MSNDRPVDGGLILTLLRHRVPLTLLIDVCGPWLPESQEVYEEEPADTEWLCPGGVRPAAG
jgi:hypothetical protein